MCRSWILTKYLINVTRRCGGETLWIIVPTSPHQAAALRLQSFDERRPLPLLQWGCCGGRFCPKHYYLLHPHTTSMTHEFRFKPISTFPVWLKNKQKNNNVVLKLMMTHIYLYLRHYFKFLLESSSQQHTTHTTQTRIQELKIIRLKILSFSASPRPPLVLPFSSKQCSDFCWFFKSKGSITNWLENEYIWSNITTSNSSWAWPLHIQFLHLFFSVSHY